MKKSAKKTYCHVLRIPWKSFLIISSIIYCGGAGDRIAWNCRWEKVFAVTDCSFIICWILSFLFSWTRLLLCSGHLPTSTQPVPTRKARSNQCALSFLACCHSWLHFVYGDCVSVIVFFCSDVDACWTILFQIREYILYNYVLNFLCHWLTAITILTTCI